MVNIIILNPDGSILESFNKITIVIKNNKIHYCDNTSAGNINIGKDFSVLIM